MHSVQWKRKLPHRFEGQMHHGYVWTLGSLILWAWKAVRGEQVFCIDSGNLMADGSCPMMLPIKHKHYVLKCT